MVPVPVCRGRARAPRPQRSRSAASTASRCSCRRPSVRASRADTPGTPLTARPFCTGAGLFSASAINPSNSSRRSGANRDTSDRQRITCSTAMASAFRFEGAFPVATAYAWPAMKVYQPCRAAEAVELLDHVPRPLLGRGQQPGLVELPGPHLAQHALGKRFLRNLELRLRRRHHTLDPFRGRGGDRSAAAGPASDSLGLTPPGGRCRDALVRRCRGRGVQEDQRVAPALEGGVMTPAAGAALATLVNLPARPVVPAPSRGAGPHDSPRSVR